MAESVKVLPEEIQSLIEVSEWDMRTREGVQRFRELKAKSLPSVALDGELVYEALIPMQEELIAEIRLRYQQKNRDSLNVSWRCDHRGIQVLFRKNKHELSTRHQRYHREQWRRQIEHLGRHRLGPWGKRPRPNPVLQQ